MQVSDNEQNEKREGQFLKIEDKSKIVIQSRLVKIYTAFIDDKKTGSILWDERLAVTGLQKRSEYLYFGRVNEDTGIFRVPAGVFFQMNDNERLLGKDKKSFEWLIGKTGSGLNTKYSVARGADVQYNDELIKANTERLCKVLESYENSLQSKLADYISSDVFRIEDEPNKNIEDEPDLSQTNNEDVDPDVVAKGIEDAKKKLKK